MEKMAAERFNPRLDPRVSNGVLAALPVGRIPHDGVAYVRHMHSYLVRAPRLYLDLEQRKFSVQLGNLEYRMSGAARPSPQHRHARAVAMAAPYARFDLAASLGHTTVDERDVKLEDEPVSELIRELLMREIILRYD
jgi:hypothetical protein